MSLSQKLSELLSRPKELRQGFPWTFYGLISPGLTTLELVLAAGIIANMLANNGVLRQETAQAVAGLAENLDKLKILPSPAEALAIILVVHKGGHLLMSIIEKVIQPLLVAQRQLGYAEGRTEGHAEGRTEGHAEGRTEGHAEGRTEGHAEGRTEGHAEGRTEERTEWREWLDRKSKAEAEGKSFDEPPPDERE